MTAPLALTAEQQAAVEASDGPYLLVAPPGSGKTEVLVRRAIWLLEQSPGEMFAVLGLTYTTKAAEELRTRVQEALGEESWRVTAATFHSFCLDMLTHYGEPVGVEPEVTVYDEELRGFALVDALRDAGLFVDQLDAPIEETAVKACLAAIDRLRADLVPPDLGPEADCLPGVSLREAYTAYDRALEAAGALDFSAMLFKAHQLLVTDSWVVRHYQRQYRHVLVDEAHDLNRIQYELLRVLFLDSARNVFMVADADQEIFTFAGASSEHIRRFAEEFSATRLPLSTNFRCAAAIVDAAERLKAHFTSGRQPKLPMVPATPAPGWVVAWSLEDEAAEAAAAAKWVQGLLADGLPHTWLHEGEDARVLPERIGIIGRTRYAFDHVAAELDQRELPYVLRTEEGGLFDSAVGRAVYFGLRVVANPQDRVSRRRLAAHVRDMGTDVSAAREPHALYTATDDDPGVFLRGLTGSAVFPEALAEALIGGAESVEDMVYALAEVDAGEPADAGASADMAAADLWRRDRERLLGWWKDYAALTRPAERTVPGFLRHLARLQRTSPSDPGIRLLTPYRAKGMQFRAVVVLGMNEGTFPFYRALTDDKIDEERRAIYVTVTRAERGLLLTRPRSRVTSWGNVRSDPPSRFLVELGLPVDEL